MKQTKRINENNIDWERIKIGVEKYQDIMKMFNDPKVDVSKDRDFQKKFVSFYRVRRSREKFLNKYFELMQELRYKNDISFRDVLTRIELINGKMEVSFSSKLLATIDISKPIWDANVLKSMLNISKYEKLDIDKACERYAKIEQYYDELFESKEALYLIELFNKHFPNNNISDVKKIDFIYWQAKTN